VLFNIIYLPKSITQFDHHLTKSNKKNPNGINLEPSIDDDIPTLLRLTPINIIKLQFLVFIILVNSELKLQDEKINNGMTDLGVES